ncbi:alpha/beta hydrolase [Micromonospora sp. NPDC005367]|uniref:alpha/beta fold hydrolase n=1 Tax=Micromonospora sp. NPDC005367 TaxID=3155590 RepID=UPI0033A9B2DF
MIKPKPTVVLVHGAFAESASRPGVVEQLQANGVRVVAVANPLRSVPGDAAYLRDVIAGIDGLGPALTAYPVTTGGNELAIRPDTFHHQFAADVSPAQAEVLSATQRPVTEVALTEGLPSDVPAWQSVPSWFVFSDEDRCIPVALHRFMAERAGAKDVREVPGASHTLSVSHPDVVTASILEAVDAVAA